MLLSDKQWLFLQDVAKLIAYAKEREAFGKAIIETRKNCRCFFKGNEAVWSTSWCWWISGTCTIY